MEQPLQGDGVVAESKPSKTSLVVAFARAHWMNLALVMVALLTVIIVVMLGRPTFFGLNGTQEEQYVLVPENISKSASIPVRPPDGFSQNDIRTSLHFDPAIEGTWKVLGAQLYFVPKSPLAEGKYYRAILSNEKGQLQKDFYIDTDPAVEFLLPKKDAEADENGQITVIYNRPIVALTDLGKEVIPNITLTPVTQGTWKWISTRTLQFTPATHLVRSAHYEVRIDGVPTVEGLVASGGIFDFSTRLIHPETAIPYQLSYDQPLEIHFNQPVDLVRTNPEIRISSNGKSVPLTVVYGSRKVRNEGDTAVREVQDPSILRITPLRDRFGRLATWDADTEYAITFGNIYPKGGDIPFDGSALSATLHTGKIVSGIWATSPLSTNVSTELFDPEGVLWFQFVESVDITKIQVETKGEPELKYGETCKALQPGEEQLVGDANCEKVADHHQVGVSFHSAMVSQGETMNVVLRNVVNDSGVLISPEPFTQPIRIYPTPKVIATFPAQGAMKADLRSLTLCTNVPLKYAGDSTTTNVISADQQLIMNRWEPSYYQGDTIYGPTPCPQKTYVTRVNYGLVPNTLYHLSLKLVDDFGQKFQLPLTFTTGAPDHFYMRFQNLQKWYNVTTPEHTKLTYLTENFDYVDLSVCRMSPEDFLALTTKPPSRVVSPDTFSCTQRVNKRITLPQRYWVNNFFQVDLKELFPEKVVGNYILTFSHPNFTSATNYEYPEKNPRPYYDHTFISVSNLVTGEKRVLWSDGSNSYTGFSDRKGSTSPQGDRNLYWVTHAGTLAPESDATVSLYQHTGVPGEMVLRGSATTDASGIARITSYPDVAGVVIHKGDESAVISDWADRLNYANSAYDGGRTYIYTDRPIYRPGDEIFIKGIDRVGYDGTYEVLKKPITLTVRNSQYEDIATLKVPITDNGTFSTSVKLPANAPLGSYAITALHGSAYVDVEAYKQAAFKLSADFDKKEYFANDTAKLAVDAQYYFGVPVADGKLEYEITAQDYHFDRSKDPDFTFDHDWYGCYDCGYGDSYLGRKEVRLDAKGKATISEVLDFARIPDAASQKKSKIITVHLTLTDKNGRVVSAQSSVILHRAKFYLDSKIDQRFVAKQSPIAMKVKSVDVEGNPVSESADVVVSRVKWDTYKRQEVDGGFYYHSERTLVPVGTTSITTNAQGIASLDLIAGEEGEYQIEIKGVDNDGNPVVSTDWYYVYGTDVVDVRPLNNETLDIVTEKKKVNTGENARIIVTSPYPHAKALITVERGQIFRYEIVDVVGNLFSYTIPVLDQYAPNMYVSVLLLSPTPELKFGQADFEVNSESHALAVTVMPEKENYLPGEDVALRIHVNDIKGKPQRAEVSLAAVDLSVLALVGNPKKDPMKYFYDGFPLTVSTLSSIKNMLYEVEIPTGTKGGSGSEADELSKKKRGEFRDTAYWNANVMTDEHGDAAVHFTLPDNLTTWQVEAVAVASDTHLGVGYHEFSTKKDVMVTPIFPRFVIPGDEFVVEAKIFNQSSARQTFRVSIASTTLEGETDSRSVAIAPSETETVLFHMRAPSTIARGKHFFEIQVAGNTGEDTVDETIPITEPTAYDVFATAASSVADFVREFVMLPKNALKDRGDLRVSAQGNLALYMDDGFRSLLAFPYGCAEQVASQLRALLIVSDAAKRKIIDPASVETVVFSGVEYRISDAIQAGLSKLIGFQNSDGGFGYYRAMQSDPDLTRHVLAQLLLAREMGYAVPNETIVSAGSFLVARLQTGGRTSYVQNMVPSQSAGSVNLSSMNYAQPVIEYEQLSPIELIESALLVQNIPELKKQKSLFRARIDEVLQKLHWQENFSDRELIGLDRLTQGESGDLHVKVRDTLLNRTQVDARGSYLSTNSQDGYYGFETEISDTAQFVSLLAMTDQNNPLLDRMLRWLLASRGKDGGWGSTNNTGEVLAAMSTYMKATKVEDQAYTLDAKFDNQPLSGITISSTTRAHVIDTSVAVSRFADGLLHTVTFEKNEKGNVPGRYYYDLRLRYGLPVDQITKRDEGFTVARTYYHVDDTDMLTPVSEAKPGEMLHARLVIMTPKTRSRVAVEDFIPAGMELVNFRLHTEDQAQLPDMVPSEDRGKYEVYATDTVSVVPKEEGFISRFFAMLGISNKKQVAQDDDEGYVDTTRSQREEMYTLYPSFEELRDDRVFLFVERLEPGIYTYDYYVRAQVPGLYQHQPASVSELYFPEHFGRSAGEFFTVKEE